MRKHGRYDKARGLPDNSDQPQGSGLIVWFHEQICARFEDGAALIEESKQHGALRYRWLLEELRRREAGDLAEAYRQRKNAEQVARSWQEKYCELASIEYWITEGKISDAQREYFEKRAAKLRKSIEKHEAKEK